MDLTQDASEPGDERLVELTVPARADRLQELRRALDGLDIPTWVREDGQLLMTELVSNSIRHARLTPRDRIRVRASWDGSKLRVDVRDASPTGIASPVAGTIRPAPTAESGWGLYLVDRLAVRWGTAPGRHWFELEGSEAEGDDPA